MNAFRKALRKQLLKKIIFAVFIVFITILAVLNLIYFDMDAETFIAELWIWIILFILVGMSVGYLVTYFIRFRRIIEEYPDIDEDIGNCIHSEYDKCFFMCDYLFDITAPAAIRYSEAVRVHTVLASRTEKTGRYDRSYIIIYDTKGNKYKLHSYTNNRFRYSNDTLVCKNRDVILKISSQLRTYCVNAEFTDLSPYNYKKQNRKERT